MTVHVINIKIPLGNIVKTAHFPLLQGFALNDKSTVYTLCIKAKMKKRLKKQSPYVVCM